MSKRTTNGSRDRREKLSLQRYNEAHAEHLDRLARIAPHLTEEPTPLGAAIDAAFTGCSEEEFDDLFGDTFEDEKECRICGCTDDEACITDAPCSWEEDDLCSACKTALDLVAHEALIVSAHFEDGLAAMHSLLNRSFKAIRALDDAQLQSLIKSAQLLSHAQLQFKVFSALIEQPL
jgi:hypothetical protein